MSAEPSRAAKAPSGPAFTIEEGSAPVTSLQPAAADPFEEIQQLRRRVLFHAEDRAQLKRELAAAEQLVQQLRGEVQDLRSRVEEPLRAAQQESASLRRELDFAREDRHLIGRDLELAREQLAHWHRVAGSRGYRLVRSYHAVYGLPGVGRLLRMLRRGVGRVLR